MSLVFPVICSFYLGTFFGVFVINLVSMNKNEENDDEYQND